MKILCTCPGRHGDILLAFPTLRALAERTNTAVALAVAPAYRGVCELALLQPYIAEAFAIPDWVIEEAAPITPYIPQTIPPGYDLVFHLGYKGWPLQALAFEHYRLLLEQWPMRSGPMPTLDIVRPWLCRPYPPILDRPWVSLGWSEEWLELKIGITVALAHRFPQVQFQWIRPWAPSRYDEIGSTGQALPKNVCIVHAGWAETARTIGRSRVFIGCNSAASHVATGLGVPVVMVEPAEARWHPIFYSYGAGGPQVTLVKGNDGRPTFDARHVGDALEKTLTEAHA